MCRALNYFKIFLIFASAVNGCISAFDSLTGVTVGIASFAAGLKNCALTAGIVKYRSIIKKKRKNKIKKGC